MKEKCNLYHVNNFKSNIPLKLQNQCKYDYNQALDMIDIDRQLMRSFWSHKIA